MPKRSKEEKRSVKIPFKSRCPECGAYPGQRCSDRSGGRLRGKAHLARWHMTQPQPEMMPC